MPPQIFHGMCCVYRLLPFLLAFLPLLIIPLPISVYILCAYYKSFFMNYIKCDFNIRYDTYVTSKYQYQVLCIVGTWPAYLVLTNYTNLKWLTMNLEVQWSQVGKYAKQNEHLNCPLNSSFSSGFHLHLYERGIHILRAGSCAID